jgi:hypothetical protein
MTDESQDRPEYPLAIPRERLEDLIERRAQAARRRSLGVRRLVLMCLVAAGIGAAGSVVATHGILRGNGDGSSPARAADPSPANVSATERAAPVGERTASAMMAETKGVQSQAPAPDRSRVVTARPSHPERVARQKLQPKRASTCERLQQELASCTGPAPVTRFGRQSSSPLVQSQAP